MAFTPSKNEKRQNSACNSGAILTFSENQRQSTFHPRRKAPFLPLKTARTAGRRGRTGAEKRQAFLLLRRLRLRSLPKTARRWLPSALAAFATLPHVGATSGFGVFGEYALGCAAKTAQTADTGATARNTLPVTSASPSRTHLSPAKSPDRAHPVSYFPAADSKLPSFRAAILFPPRSGGR